MSVNVDALTLSNIAAILLSPVIAVLITLWHQRRQQKRDSRMYILTTLFANRHFPTSEACVQALNMIDVAFLKNKRVRQLWREYFEMLGNSGLDNQPGYEQRQEKNRDLIYEMARSLGYHGAITHNDMQRIYIPRGLGMAAARQEELANELLRVLKASGGLSVSPKA